MAIKKLKVLGNGFSVIPMGGRYLVQAVPGELTMDHTTILQHAEVGFDNQIIKSQRAFREIVWNDVV